MRTSSITQKAQAQLGIKKLRKHQIKPIQSILDGYDTMVIAPTSKVSWTVMTPWSLHLPLQANLLSTSCLL